MRADDGGASHPIAFIAAGAVFVGAMLLVLYNVNDKVPPDPGAQGADPGPAAHQVLALLTSGHNGTTPGWNASAAEWDETGTGFRPRFVFPNATMDMGDTANGVMGGRVCTFDDTIVGPPSNDGRISYEEARNYFGLLGGDVPFGLLIRIDSVDCGSVGPLPWEFGHEPAAGVPVAVASTRIQDEAGAFHTVKVFVFAEAAP